MRVIKIYDIEEWYPELPHLQITMPDQNSTLYIQSSIAHYSTHSLKSSPTQSKKSLSKVLSRLPRRSTRVCQKFRCPDTHCKLVFKTMEHLIDHMLDGHIYTCPIDKCNHTEDCLNSLAKHIMAEHDNILKNLVSDEAMDLYSLICESKSHGWELDREESSSDISEKSYRRRHRRDSAQDLIRKKPRLEDEMLILDCLV